MYCCFTGHRPEHLLWISKEDTDRCQKLKETLSDVIDSAINDGYTDFYCGMARGIDTYAAEAIIDKMQNNKNLRLHAVLPCPDQQLNWPQKDKDRFEKILAKTSTKTIISPLYTDTCMLSRNRFMVDNSDRLIAVWNGFFKGGTAYTVRYAKNENKEIHLIRPKDLSVTIL
ncbi:MAG: DUF1273 family protein [Clostridia bacterium]|nr:DUF1273 family protein [Clostridia bacterium]